MFNYCGRRVINYFFKVLFKGSVFAQRKRCVCIMKVSQLMLLRDIITVYSENRTGLLSTLWGQNAEFLIVISRDTQ